MSENAENHTIKLLQEMRKEITQRFDGIDQQFSDVNTRIDGLTHIVTLLAANMGGHENRIIDLELAMAEMQGENGS